MFVRCRVNAKLAVLLALAPAALAQPSIGVADTGGAGISSGARDGQSTATAQPANAVRTTTAGGITLTVRASALLRHRVRFAGTVQGSPHGSTVVVQRLDPAWGWIAAATAVVASDGSFTATWTPQRAGRIAVRAVLGRPGDGAATAYAAATTPGASTPPVDLLVYRPAIATIYGDGFFGQQTACGATLRRSTLGVAHRTLPCGTLVSIYYAGRSIVVPVIDRGPYANHASWDLTSATADALGMTGTATIGAVTVGHRRAVQAAR
jgi:hypothetical protein